MARTALITILFALGIVSASAAAQTSVSASSNRTSLAVGEMLRYRLEIVGDIPSINDVNPPSGIGLTLVQHTPTLRQQSRVGNRESLTLEWTYRAEQAGTARLESISIPFGNRSIHTDPIEIDVTTAGTPSTPRAPAPLRPPSTSGSELFIRAEPNRESAFVGQQVVVNYVLYFDATLTPRETEHIGTWDAPGFWKEELDIPYEDTYPQPVTIDDRAFRVVTIRRLALFPTRRGNLRLPEMDFRVRLARSRRSFDPFAGFFGSLGWEEEETTAPETTIRVNALPPDAPRIFSGAVGHFTMNSALAPTSVETGEPVQLSITLRGNGNIATLEEPDIELPPSIERLDPTEEREINRTARHVSGSKSFKTTLIPTDPGTLEIPPISWSYYDPDQRSYETLSTPAYRIAVTGSPLAASRSKNTAPEGPMPLMTKGRRLKTPSVSPTILSILLVGGLLIPLVIALGTTGTQRWRTRLREESPAKRKRKALPKAMRALRNTPNTTSPREHTNHVEAILRQLIVDRTGDAVHTLPRNSFSNAFEGTLSAETLRKLDRFLSDCHRATFAPGDTLETGLVDQAKRLAKRITAET